MQSKRPTKTKTSQTAETIPAVAAEFNPAPAPKRASTSSRPKNESSDAVSAKRHRPTKAAAPASEPATTLETVPVAVEKLLISEIAETPAEVRAAAVVNEEEVRRLAYLLWVERGCPHGSHHDDWFRAEKALTARF